MLTLALSILSPMLIAMALWLSWRAAQTARSPQGAVGWVVFLLAAPYVAVFVYAVFGPHRYKSRIRGRRASRRLFDTLRPEVEEEPGAAYGGIDPGPFETIAGLPVVRGNRVALLIDGAETFDAIFAAIDAAERYVLLQFYTFRDDKLGRDMAARLKAAVARGAEVRVAYDFIGSSSLSAALLHDMVAGGVKILRKRKVWMLSRRFQINFRNHRKTVVVDGRVGFIGGLNVGDEYMGRAPEFGPWRDTFCSIEGPMVTQLQLIFAEDWHWLTGEVLKEKLDWAPRPTDGPVNGLIVATGPINSDDGGAAMYFAAIAAARQRIWISTPYFVPDMPLVALLKHAALQGKDVRILVPEAIDHYLPWLAAFAYFDELTEAGVQILRYERGFMHQKAMLIDDHLTAIGSTNFDQRSFRLNFESMAMFLDADLAREFETMLLADFAKARRLERSLDQQPFPIRVGAPMARLLAPIL